VGYIKAGRHKMGKTQTRYVVHGCEKYGFYELEPQKTLEGALKVVSNNKGHYDHFRIIERKHSDKVVYDNIK
jgi:hypothetical protein